MQRLAPQADSSRVPVSHHARARTHTVAAPLLSPSPAAQAYFLIFFGKNPLAKAPRNYFFFNGRDQV